jgi:hypothetical protein
LLHDHLSHQSVLQAPKGPPALPFKPGSSGGAWPGTRDGHGRDRKMRSS